MEAFVYDMLPLISVDKLGSAGSGPAHTEYAGAVAMEAEPEEGDGMTLPLRLPPEDEEDEPEAALGRVVRGYEAILQRKV